MEDAIVDPSLPLIVDAALEDAVVDPTLSFVLTSVHYAMGSGILDTLNMRVSTVPTTLHLYENEGAYVLT